MSEVEFPPPQASRIEMKHALALSFASRFKLLIGKGRTAVNLKLAIERLFSRWLCYFIVERMNPFAHTLKYPVAKRGGFRAIQWGMTLVLLFLLLLASQPAYAEWQRVTTTDSGIIYVDDGTIKRNGPIRSFWSLLDYRTPQKAQRGAYFVSTRTHMEMDCRKELVHILQFSMHSGPMLTGEIIDSQGVMREWQTIPPDTPLVALYKFICGK